MIYISAQSDDLYFLWQLEVQLENFISLGISPDNIHVLIGFDPVRGLTKEYERLTGSGRARFFLYADERKSKNYKSSIRPHILQKHFTAHPYLAEETIFYHDCDIIFRERVNEKLLGEGRTWYLSATPYISYRVIEEKGGREVVDRLCEIVGVSVEMVERNEPDTGGAQYVLKNISASFWEKVEADSEQIHTYLMDVNIRENKGLQAWCADMWAVLWNGLLFGYPVKVHPDLDFCWPKDHIDRWYETGILHNSGVIHHEADTYFCKGLYINHTPYFSNFSQLDDNSCSRQYVNYIEQFQANIKRADLRDVTFVFPVRIESKDDLTNLDTVTRYLAKHIDTNIQVLEIDDLSRINKRFLYPGVEHFFFLDEKQHFNCAAYINSHIPEIRTPILVIGEPDCIIPLDQVLQAVQSIRDKEAGLAYPFDGAPKTVRQEALLPFKETLDITTLSQRLSKERHDHRTSRRISRFYGGFCFLDTDLYITSGMENERIPSWGEYNHLERNKRLNILGVKEYRVPGSCFRIESFVPFMPEQFRISTLSADLREYIRICGMRKGALEEDIATWHPAKKIPRISVKV